MFIMSKMPCYFFAFSIRIEASVSHDHLGSSSSLVCPDDPIGSLGWTALTDSKPKWQRKSSNGRVRYKLIRGILVVWGRSWGDDCRYERGLIDQVLFVCILHCKIHELDGGGLSLVESSKEGFLELQLQLQPTSDICNLMRLRDRRGCKSAAVSEREKKEWCYVGADKRGPGMSHTKRTLYFRKR